VFALADREALLQAVDVAFAVPGDTIRDALYERIARTYQVRREEIPEKLKVFHLALEDLLGTSAPVMERLIAKDFYGRLKLDFLQHNGWTLIDYVDHAKKVERHD
jgi:hypothetical protein